MDGPTVIRGHDYHYETNAKLMADSAVIKAKQELVHRVAQCRKCQADLQAIEEAPKPAAETA